MVLTSNEIEAANRAEVTALLIRNGYRVYRPEADVAGEDLVVRTPEGELRAVQLKARLTVDEKKYGGDKSIWMLFPDGPFDSQLRRQWYLVPHKLLFDWLKEKHGHTDGWNDTWSSKTTTVAQRALLVAYRLGGIAS